MLKLSNVSVKFDSKIILKNINCTVQENDFVIIVGANGSGKSTFFNTIAGHIQPSSGKIIWGNKTITDMHEAQRSSIISRLFQNPNLNSVSSMTVRQNLAMAFYKNKMVQLKNGFKSINNNIITELAQEFEIDLNSLLDQPMHSLSGGQRQLIAFLMAIVIPPKILLLDEPTAALDPEAATKLLLCVQKYIKKHKIITLLITHDPHLACIMGNKVWVLDQGIIQHKYDKNEKKTLHPDELIGSITYEQIKD